MMNRFSRWARLSPFDYFFSLYAAGAAAVLVALTSWFVPEVNSRCSTVDDRTLIYGCNFDLSLNENWLYWATFLAIAVVPFFLGYRVALSRLQISGRIKGWVLLIRGIVPIVPGIPQIKPTFLEIAPSGIPSNIIPHSKGVKCGLIRSKAGQFVPVSHIAFPGSLAPQQAETPAFWHGAPTVLRS